MLGFDSPWVFYLLPLPILAYFLIPRARQQQAAVRVPFYNELSALQQQTNNTLARRKSRIAAVLLIWCCLIVAASGPNWIGDPISLPTSGRDLLLAVDLSGSMEIEDMQVGGERAQRIIAVKAVLNQFIPQRKGDRLGLVLFGTQAYVQAPLTFDLATVQRFMREAQIGFAGEERTAIGDAIGLSVKRLRERPGNRHVMILLTDGQNNGGEVKPIPAAKLAADNNIIIYTVGVGADEMAVPGLFGSRRVNPSADLDETTLKEIANITGGKYFRARNPEELMQIYQLLDQLEPVEDKQHTFRPQQALFYWPLAAGFIASVLLALTLLPWSMWFHRFTNNALVDEKQL
ncbi:MAG: VWA domain-containing protein [Spongiibacteraceae bacterium]